MVKELFLIRGLPNAGKTTFSKLLINSFDQNHFISVHLEQDSYFYDPQTLSYKFNPFKRETAKKWCINECIRYMEDEYDFIIVSNTFTTKNSLTPYFNAAERFGYKTTSIIIENRHMQLNPMSMFLQNAKNNLLNSIKLM